jgi:hypothetical protein
MQFNEIIKLMNVCIISEKRNLGELVKKNKTYKVFKIQEQIDIKKRDYLTFIVNRKVAETMVQLCEILYYETQKNEPIDWKKISKYLIHIGKNTPTVATKRDSHV